MEEKTGLYVGWAKPQKKSRLIFKNTFYATGALPPTGCLVAISLIHMAGKLPVQTGQADIFVLSLNRNYGNLIVGIHSVLPSFVIIKMNTISGMQKYQQVLCCLFGPLIRKTAACCIY